MPESPLASTPPEAGALPVRSRRLVIVLAALGAVSAVIAAVVIFSSGGSTTPPEEPEAQVTTSSKAVVVGDPDAPARVVVYEDYGSHSSREFEIASRDFLRVEAAAGQVRVEYRPFHLTDGYSREALRAWGAVLDGGTAEQALAFHDLLFDRQPFDDGSADQAPDFEAWAVETGVDRGVVSDEIKGSESAFVDAARDGARAAAIGVVPTVLVNGRLIGAGNGIRVADQLQRVLLKDSPG